MHSQTITTIFLSCLFLSQPKIGLLAATKLSLFGRSWQNSTSVGSLTSYAADEKGFSRKSQRAANDVINLGAEGKHDLNASKNVFTGGLVESLNNKVHIRDNVHCVHSDDQASTQNKLTNNYTFILRAMKNKFSSLVQLCPNANISFGNRNPPYRIPGQGRVKRSPVNKNKLSEVFSQIKAADLEKYQKVIAANDVKTLYNNFPESINTLDATLAIFRFANTAVNVTEKAILSEFEAAERGDNFFPENLALSNLKTRTDVKEDKWFNRGEEMFKDGEAKEAQKRSNSGKCDVRIDSTVLALPGCVPKQVIVTRCQGQCTSMSVPEWREVGVALVGTCTCCSPLQIKWKTFELHCPGNHRGRPSIPNAALRISLPYPLKCMCRPCDDAPEVRAEQPYDY